MYSFNLFSEGYLDQYLKYQLAQAKDQIKSLSLQALEDPDFVQKQVDERTIASPELDFEGVFASSYEKEIPASHHPNSFFMDEGRSFPRQVIVYHVPLKGSVEMLKYMPNPAIVWSEEVLQERSAETTNICFEIINFGDDAERVKRSFDEFKQKVTTQLGHIQNQISGYNSGLETFVKECVEARKNELGKQKGVLDSLGVPVKGQL